MGVSVSFRDPAGSVYCSEDRVLRSVTTEYVNEFSRFLSSGSAQRMIAAGLVVGTRELPASVAADTGRSLATLGEAVSRGSRLYEHERVWFPSYPHEWAPEMLHEAGRLTLELAGKSLQDGFGLKDATPFNVLFRGPEAVFVDLLSFERRSPSDCTWLPYAQFLRMFILPLLAYKEFGTKPHELLALRPHGIEPEELYARCSRLQRLRPGFLGTVSIPTWLGRNTTPRYGTSQLEANSGTPGTTAPGALKTGSVPDEKATYILQSQFRRLSRLLNKVKPESNEVKSVWSDYTAMMSYSSSESERKKDLVRHWLSEAQAQTVLDIGCNTGCFSEIAARLGASVVSIDSDPVVVGRLWSRAKLEQLNVLPLVVDLAHPTPASGWRNAENHSFLDRANGRFDAVLMLAVIHHLLVTERVALEGILDVAAGLTRNCLVIEYVDRTDPMFQRLTRGREELHKEFTNEYFERVCRQQFTILKRLPLKEDLRILYLLQKKT